MTNARQMPGNGVGHAWNEWFSSNRKPMFCAQDSGIARGQILRVATKKCMAWCCFCVKSSVFGHRMPHFALILWETEVTNVGVLKFQVSVWLMRKILSINTPCVRLSVKFMFTEFTQTWRIRRKGLEIYSANLGIRVGGLAHLSV